MADWAMVILTGIYVIATILICRFNYGATKASREQLAEMRRQFDEENRPYITVELILERRLFYGLRFTNHGKRVANHVSIQLDQSFLDSISKESFKTALNKAQGKECIIGVGQHYDLFIGSTELRKQNEHVVISGQVKYCDGNSNYSEEFSIDFDSYATFYSVESDTEIFLEKFKNQTETLVSINRALWELVTINNIHSESYEEAEL